MIDTLRNENERTPNNRSEKKRNNQCGKGTV